MVISSNLLTIAINNNNKSVPALSFNMCSALPKNSFKKKESKKDKLWNYIIRLDRQRRE